MQQSEFQLRHLAPDDHQAIVSLWQRTGLKSVRLSGRDSQEAMVTQAASGVQEIIGLVDDQRLIAVIVATHDGRKGWLNRLAVDPDYRGQGLARRLIREAQTWLTKQSIDVWAALIEDHNDVSVQLFRSEGYTVHDDIIYLSKRTEPCA
jgi:ribosomal protein S18 acetylase RimI-like enzyme